MSRKTHYAVAIGRKPGIYTQWDGEGGARAQVDGFPGARYKGFTSHKEAKKWLEEQRSAVSGQRTAVSDQRSANSGQRSAISSQRAEGRHRQSGASRQLPGMEPQPGDPGAPVMGYSLPPNASPAQTVVTIYTDGSALRNPGPGGYAAVILANGERREISGGFRYTTNNRMELTACIQALRALPEGSQVKLISDSRYVVNGITRYWAVNWRANGWQRKVWDEAEGRTVNRPAENADLWAQLLELCALHRVEFKWLPGHAGIRENERCDELAQRAAQGRDLPEDEGYVR